MSNTLILLALQKRLAAMAGVIATAGENIDYKPVVGTPYQEIALLPASPDNVTAGLVHHRKVGVFQIMLRYPQFQGSGAARRYADLLELHFRRATLLQESGLNVLVTHTPATGPAQKDGDRYCLPISVRYQADVFQ